MMFPFCDPRAMYYGGPPPHMCFYPPPSHDVQHPKSDESSICPPNFYPPGFRPPSFPYAKLHGVSQQPIVHSKTAPDGDPSTTPKPATATDLSDSPGAKKKRLSQSALRRDASSSSDSDSSECDSAPYKPGNAASQPRAPPDPYVPQFTKPVQPLDVKQRAARIPLFKVTKYNPPSDTATNAAVDKHLTELLRCIKAGPELPYSAVEQKLYGCPDGKVSQDPKDVEVNLMRLYEHERARLLIYRQETEEFDIYWRFDVVLIAGSKTDPCVVVENWEGTPQNVHVACASSTMKYKRRPFCNGLPWITAVQNTTFDDLRCVVWYLSEHLMNFNLNDMILRRVGEAIKINIQKKLLRKLEEKREKTDSV